MPRCDFWEVLVELESGVEGDGGHEQRGVAVAVVLAD